MNDYYSRYSIKGDSPLRESFDVYLNDKHAAFDRIAMLNDHQAHDLIRGLMVSAPHAVAKELAIHYPWGPTAADEAERFIQDSLY